MNFFLYKTVAERYAKHRPTSTHWLFQKLDRTPGDDYIDQLQCQSRHSHRFSSVQYEPKWKYKIIRRTPNATPFDKLGQVILIVSSIAAVIYIFSSDGVTTGERIFYGAVIGLVLIILFFALREGTEANDQNAEEQNDRSSFSGKE